MADPGKISPRVNRARMARRGGTRPSRATAREDVRDDVREEPLMTEERMVRKGIRRTNPFDIDKRLIPPGVSYEWKREVCYGWKDIDHQVELRDNCWRPVLTERHPHMMPPETEASSPIRRGGMILMERPEYLTEEAAIEDYENAIEAVEGVQQQMFDAPPDTMTRNHQSVRNVSRIKAERNSAERIIVSSN